MKEELKKMIDGKVDGKQLSIANLDGGGAIELIDTAIEDVVRNCVSLNHKLKTSREVIFKIKIHPVDENRTLVKLDYDVDTKLAKRIPISETTEYPVGVDGTKGPFIKSKVHQEQIKIFDNITQLRKER